MTLYRIFIVEDDPVIVSALCAHMENGASNAGAWRISAK